MTLETNINKASVRKNFSSQAKDYDRYAVVQQVVAKRLAELLKAYRQDWSFGLEIGCGTGLLTQQLLTLQPELQLMLSDIAHGMTQYIKESFPQFVACDADAAALPFTAGSFDLVVSSSVYQWLNDFPNAFRQVSHVLLSNGILALALFGEKTLYELRDSHRSALVDRESHVQSFPSRQEISAALGEQLEIVELRSEFEVEWHENVPALLKSLKKIGAQNASKKKPRGLASRKTMHEMIAHYENRYRTAQGIPATYEVIYLIARRR
ncbi:malonyl-CoA O-methyltransferase [Malonomonas rubra DSM 5091]|uniref:Malonyl-[acyl-carrier protein] O-methyltransferase n=1 Tax=Malonomonas rubra DSM 5091 TaxID=1122189 RepID=A0A1M6BAA6_MALRU|nr:malonyl-ACP O-methyltransferase BioC [Malonomonas rubra]SHI45642.1 malonyl-CoA O-methyltransferase [Malonomonas rubra DSM 5091]